MGCFVPYSTLNAVLELVVQSIEVVGHSSMVCMCGWFIDGLLMVYGWFMNGLWMVY